MDDGEADGFEAGASGSRGDPRVLLALNAALSASFGATVVWGLSMLDAAELSVINVATATIVLFSLTYLVAMR
ncbi:uncharacterized protein Nmlp_2122 [Natronomonas moolapensis 8.8.11]|jgi:hypothetical protein|uniref:DUF8107 domain-containing protein n=1 Tax=Natronomonas moolapensis (strain DSM 18674 / CECT 7526 / JCM 14361 / 8.8.11) TaxID=268739 RepID=M1XQA9_NATM8|nr:hypothetical protein [Natronomonas moolapensis]CCQ36304.1 uncharacterized protein Nmlp_2122 [Natronomonas moolapensis 8.8.11]